MKEIMIKELSTGSYEHEFNVSDEGELWTSDDKLWTTTARNKRVMSVDDNGNGYAIKMHENGKLLLLGYAEAVQLYIMLSELMDVRIDFVEKTVVKSI
jgi:beta-lactamase superfamily II metal-dependent hydrolase